MNTPVARRRCRHLRIGDEEQHQRPEIERELEEGIELGFLSVMSGF